MYVPDIGKLENDDDLKTESSPPKKAKFCFETLNSMREVAELLLVLSAVSNIRGGKKPTVVENDMMESAKEKLVELCGKIAPNDILSVDAIGTVIEDLGLNKIREQKRGPRHPRMTIAEKMILTKRKMEESKGFMLQTSKYPSHAVAENMGKTFSVGMLTPFNQNHSSVSNGVVKSTFSAQPISCSTSLPYQVSEDVKMSAIPNNLSGIQSGNDQPPINNTIWSLQSQLPSSTKHGLEKKLNNQTLSFDGKTTNSLKVGLHGPVDQTGKTLTSTKATSGALHQKPLQNVNPDHVSSSFNHGEIVKFIQKLWQHRQGARPAWIPPSKDYVNKLLTCQICKMVTNEVQSVLICDSCEKGFHLQCIQSSIIKGIPRGEWHCVKCLTLSNGKPLPPKYGRVMRNMTIVKGPSNAAAVLSSPVKKTMSLEQVMSPRKEAGILDTTAPDSTSVELSASNRYGSSVQSFPDATTSGSNSLELSCNQDASDDKEVQGLMSKIDEPKENEKVCSDGSLNELISCSLPQVVKSGEGLHQGNDVHFEAEYEPLGKNSSTLINSGGSQALIRSESAGHNLMSDFEVALKQHCVDNSISDQTIDCFTIQDERIMDKDVEMGDDHTKSTDKSKLSSDEVLSVDWVGEMVDVMNEKTFFKCCNINGITYTANDYAFFSPCNEKLVPCKLLAMWEDNTKEKWISVIKLHFPGDISDSVELPCPPQSNEVYQLKGEHTLLAGKIRGACHVFGLDKFNEHKNYTCDDGQVDNLHDVFMCRWWFDESEGLFGALEEV